MGGNTIKIDMMGVTISGSLLTLEAKAMAELKGAMVTVKGSAMTQVSGGIVMVG